MAFGLLGILVSLLGTVVALTILYYVIRFAVRDGVVDANRLVDAHRGPHSRV